MKTFYYLFILILVISCANPQKLVEYAEYEKALMVTTKRLKKGKAKWKNLDAFEKSFRELTEQDALYVKTLRAEGKPAVWPAIYDKAVLISDRQRKVAPVLDRLDGSNFEPVVSLYPADALLEEAADNSARYFYAGALEFLVTARNGNRQDARKAHALLDRCRDYRANFKDVAALEQEMYDLGTTHIVIQTIPGPNDPEFVRALAAEVIGGEKYPYRKNWQVFHAYEPEEEEIDYFAQLEFYDLYVGWENESSSCCSNSEEIQVGTKEEKEWNDQDSVWVTVEVPIYEEVSVTVQTYTQEKTASLRMHYNVVKAQGEEGVRYMSMYDSECWRNEYSEVSGDCRALSLLCDDEGGSRQYYPSGESLLLAAACGLRYEFNREMKRAVD